MIAAAWSVSPDQSHVSDAQLEAQVCVTSCNRTPAATGLATRVYRKAVSSTLLTCRLTVSFGANQHVRGELCERKKRHFSSRWVQLFLL